MRKLILLTLFLLSLTISASAQLQVEDTSVQYSNYASVEVDCQGSDENCPGSNVNRHELKLEVCGQVADTHTDPRFAHRSYPVTFEFHVPSDAACDTGTHPMDVSGATGSLDVSSNDIKMYGDALVFVSDAETDYPHIGHFNHILETEGIDAASRGSFNLHDYSNSGALTVNMYDDAGDFAVYRASKYAEKCTVGIFDHDESSSETGYAHVDQGVVIQQEGSWPGKDSADIAYSYFEDGNNPLGEGTPEDVYDDISGSGYSNTNVVSTTENGDSSEILKVSGGSEIFEMRGDLICGDADADGNGEWYMCHPEAAFRYSRIDDTLGQAQVCDTGTNEWVSFSCELGVVKKDLYSEYNPTGGVAVSDAIVAQYETFTGDCSTYGTMFTDDPAYIKNWVEEPTVTVCSESDSYGECAGITMGNYTDMPVAQYHATPEYFEQLAEESGTDLTEESMYTSFVEDTYGWTVQRQTLLDAEQRYSGTLEFLCESCHEYSTWEGRIKEPEATDAYNNSDTSTNIQAWNTANAGAPEDDQIASSSGQNSIFVGGFAGKCPAGKQWQYSSRDNEWRCSGGVSWDQYVFLPNSSSNDMMAVVFPHTNLWEVSDFVGSSFTEYGTYPRAVKAADRESTWGTTLSEVEITCWQGTVDDNPEDVSSDNKFNTTKSINSPEQPFGVAREISHSGNYACSWTFFSETGQKVDDVGSLSEMHLQDTELINTHFTEIEGLQKDDGENADYSNYTEFQNKVSGMNIQTG